MSEKHASAGVEKRSFLTRCHADPVRDKPLWIRWWILWVCAGIATSSHFCSVDRTVSSLVWDMFVSLADSITFLLRFWVTLKAPSFCVLTSVLISCEFTGVTFGFLPGVFFGAWDVICELDNKDIKAQRIYHTGKYWHCNQKMRI